MLFRSSDFAKPAPLQLRPLHLIDVIKDTVTLLSNQCLAQSVEVTTTFEGNGVLVQADASQVKQVVLNVLLNSLEAMSNGGRLEVATKLAGKYQVLRISDTGCGITPEHQRQIWDPFFTTKERGMGLGLSIVKGVIERHGGQIAIFSTPGKGTAVELLLPTVQ